MRFFALAFLSLCCFAQQNAPYVFGFLRAHPERKPIPEEQAMEIQKAHMEHLGRMGREFGLVGAGPLGDSPDLRGILIFKGVTVEQARAGAEQDPTVLNRRLIVDLAAWPARPGIGDKAIAKMKEPGVPKWSMNKRSIAVYWRTPECPADFTEPKAKAVAMEHHNYLKGLEGQGEIFAMAPLIGSKDFVGVVIYKTDDVAAVRKFSESDPFVKAGWVKPQAMPLFIADEVF